MVASDRPMAECATELGDREKATNKQTNEQPLWF